MIDKLNNILSNAKKLSISQNVSFRIIDQSTGKLVQEHVGHNNATNSMIYGIGRYLMGDGTLNQSSLLDDYIPKYISLGTMGLYSQECDEVGLPTGIGEGEGDEETRLTEYMSHRPGYGADGYEPAENNGRLYLGLGNTFANRPDQSKTVQCELISDTAPRSQVTFRDIIPETEAELPRTIDVVFSAMISTGALKQFREPGKDYVFITEAGLWSRKTWEDSSENGLLAGYRIVPPDSDNWDMSIPANRQKLKENILRVGINQVVQVIWKIQIGSIDQFGTGGLEPTPTTISTEVGFKCIDDDGQVVSGTAVKVCKDMQGQIVATDAVTHQPLTWTSSQTVATFQLANGIYYFMNSSGTAGPVGFAVDEGTIIHIGSTGSVVQGVVNLTISSPYVYITTNGLALLQSLRPQPTRSNDVPTMPFVQLYYSAEEHCLVYNDPSQSWAYGITVVATSFNSFDEFKSDANTYELETNKAPYPVYYNSETGYYTCDTSIGFRDKNNFEGLMTVLKPTCNLLGVSGWNCSTLNDLNDAWRGWGQNTHECSIDITNLITSNFTQMQNTFRDASIAYIHGLSELDTSRVTSMRGMFYGSAIGLENEIPLSEWNTSNLVDISWMFAWTNIAITPEFDTSNVTNMQGLFATTHLDSMREGSLEWDTSNVTNMSYMYSCGFSDDGEFDPTYIPQYGADLYIADMDTSHVTNMAYMFANTNRIWPSEMDTHTVTNMSHMFYNTTSEETYEYDLTLDTSNVTDMSSMFELDDNYAGGTTYLTVPSSIGSWDVGKVTNFSRMFKNSVFGERSEPYEFDWDTSSGINFESMFEGAVGHCEYGVIRFVHSWDMRNATNINRMFANVCQTYFGNVSYFLTGQELYHMQFSSSLQTAHNIFDHAHMQYAEGDYSNLHNYYITSSYYSERICMIRLPYVDIEHTEISLGDIYPNGYAPGTPQSDSIPSIFVSMEPATISTIAGINNFQYLLQHSYINGLHAPGWTIETSSIANLFSYTTTLQYVDLSSWDVGAVRNFNELFKTAASSGGILDFSTLDDWNVSSQASFYDAFASNLDTEGYVPVRSNKYPGAYVMSEYTTAPLNDPYQYIQRFPMWGGDWDFSGLEVDSSGYFGFVGSAATNIPPSGYGTYTTANFEISHMYKFNEMNECDDVVGSSDLVATGETGDYFKFTDSGLHIKLYYPYIHSNWTLPIGGKVVVEFAAIDPQMTDNPEPVPGYGDTPVVEDLGSSSSSSEVPWVDRAWYIIGFNNGPYLGYIYPDRYLIHVQPGEDYDIFPALNTHSSEITIERYSETEVRISVLCTGQCDYDTYTYELYDGELDVLDKNFYIGASEDGTFYNLQIMQVTVFNPTSNQR